MTSGICCRIFYRLMTPS